MSGVDRFDLPGFASPPAFRHRLDFIYFFDFTESMHPGLCLKIVSQIFEDGFNQLEAKRRLRPCSLHWFAPLKSHRSDVHQVRLTLP